MQQQFDTLRLTIIDLKLSDASFMLSLVNTPGWHLYIGNRQINSLTDAQSYTQKILSNDAYRYWVVNENNTATPIGIITFVKRLHLPYPDFGFALLPEHEGKGYAYEASFAVLAYLKKTQQYPLILATTVPNNHRSIKLLNRLGFNFEHENKVDDEVLHVYQLKVG